jgi:hypothetical protein
MAERILTEHEVFTGCGAGQGKNCCKFILLGPQDFVCGREGAMQQRLIDATEYSARRIPTEPYPLCQIQAGPTP